jgi:hypothetical protein
MPLGLPDKRKGSSMGRVMPRDKEIRPGATAHGITLLLEMNKS